MTVFFLADRGWCETNPYLSNLIARANQQKIHQNRQWQLLGHWRQKPLRGPVSDIDNPTFFLSSEGKTNPQAELHATLQAFFSPTHTTTEHPQCRFRRRYTWLRDQLQFDSTKLTEQNCDQFEEWKTTLNAKKITFIFASSYLNNPASMFGHTFLRLDRDKNSTSKPNNLLSYIVNYAADPNTKNPIFYVILGLSGGFPGSFTTLPYYLKVNEYNDLESRDIWEYELNMSPKEIKYFIEHLWEIGPHYADYWYLDENCSFHLLALLETAAPTLHLTDHFTGLVNPPETVRVVTAQPGLVRQRSFRPSLHRVMSARRAQLNLTEEDLAYALGAETSRAALEQLNTLEPTRQVAVLDASLELHQYLHRDPEEQNQAWAQTLLVARGQRKLPSAPLTITPPPAPEEGHYTSTWTLAMGLERPGSFAEIGLRPALHDLLSPEDGYAPNTQIEFLHLQLRLTEAERNIELTHFHLLKITSLSPLDRWTPKPSWRLQLGATRAREDQCRGPRCLAYGFLGGPGVAVAPLDGLLFYAFLDAEASLGRSFDDQYRIVLGTSAGFLLQPTSWWRLQAEADLRAPLLGEALPRTWRPGLATGPLHTLTLLNAFWLTSQRELRLEARAGRAWHELSLRAVFYTN